MLASDGDSNVDNMRLIATSFIALLFLPTLPIHFLLVNIGPDEWLTRQRSKKISVY